MKYGYTQGQLSTPEAGEFIYTGPLPGETWKPDIEEFTFEPSPVGSSLLRSIKADAGKTILVKPITPELQKELNIPESAAGMYFTTQPAYGHSNPTTRAIYTRPGLGSNVFVVAHEAGHAVDPAIATQDKLTIKQMPERLKIADKSAARKDPYTFLSSFMQQPLGTASAEAFAQRYAVDRLKDIGVDTAGVLQDDWYKGYPADKIVEGLDNARDYYIYTQTGANPIRPVKPVDASSVKDNRRAVANQYLNLALDKRYREQEEMLRQRGVRDINEILGPYADLD